jgi:hypothetical protein
MTLKEKIIDQVQEMPLEVNPTMKDIDNYNLSINNLEKIADEFAIGFAEWLIENKILSSKMPLRELLDMFKKEKGL